MRGPLYFGILLLSSSAASVSLAQVQTTPTPLAVTPLISGLNATLCANGCDKCCQELPKQLSERRARARCASASIWTDCSDYWTSCSNPKQWDNEYRVLPA